ncbi:PPOX class F420-dependent oxidoreductase [Streptomyces chartreusis]|nr:PPOX class F420-dependent oxidoreductase [Streptomyces chartreusis]
MHDTLLEQLGAGKYRLITSYRKNGTPVSTPVWVERDGDPLGIRTPTDSWKVKRIRGRGDILVGPCDLRGNPTGDPVPATAEVTGARYRSLIAPKYGIVDLLMILDRWLRGANRTLGIRVRLTPHHGHAGACRKASMSGDGYQAAVQAPARDRISAPAGGPVSLLRAARRVRCPHLCRIGP